MLKKEFESKNKNLYAYIYDEKNNLYIIRGISEQKGNFEPRSLSYIPSELLNELAAEHLANGGVIQNFRINFSQDTFHAIVDFNGRYFTENQIQDIIEGKKVEFPTIESLNTAQKNESIIKKIKFNRRRSLDN